MQSVAQEQHRVLPMVGQSDPLCGLTQIMTLTLELKQKQWNTKSIYNSGSHSIFNETVRATHLLHRGRLSEPHLLY